MVTYDIHYVKADPCGNTTILVLTPLPRGLYAAMARLLMQENMLCAEQVGFVEKTAQGSRLRMMGGEFCANALRSYVAWLLMGGQEYLTQGGELLRPLPETGGSLVAQVSNHGEPLMATVKYTGKPNGCFVELDMPSPDCIYHDKNELLGQYSLVGFSGISHGILWERAADSELLPHVRQLLCEHGLSDSCCGIMFVEKQQPLFMRPLVYVGEVESLVWEQSCGSGSMALLCALADRKKQSYERLPIEQPGGTLLLSGGYSTEGIRGTRLAGDIHFSGQGVVHVGLDQLTVTE